MSFKIIIIIIWVLFNDYRIDEFIRTKQTISQNERKEHMTEILFD